MCVCWRGEGGERIVLFFVFLNVCSTTTSPLRGLRRFEHTLLNVPPYRCSMYGGLSRISRNDAFMLTQFEPRKCRECD
uniref:Putative secreted protein n=1 Tax=Anopheles darlingi TaxID=43151 RepID=A0A2M4D9Q2_ANODA